MKKLGTRIFRGLILLSWMAAIYYFSNQANSNKTTIEIFGSLNYIVRKGAHITEYAVLYFLAYWFGLSFADDEPPASPPPDLRRRLEENLKTDQDPEQQPKIRTYLQAGLLPLLFCLFFAISDEWHQSFVPGRSPLLSDVAIDAAGIVLAALLSFLFAA